MLSKHSAILTAVTALAPLSWGSTYLVTSELLPPDRPFTAALFRALPAGLLLLAITRRLPRGRWWWRAAVLGTLNIGAFFALLFIAAYRLPGGLAATLGAIQPLMVAGLSALVLRERLGVRTALAGIAGVVGVGLLVLQANARLDAAGAIAALGGAVVMATGIVLSKRWTSRESVLTTTGWQLTAGGMVLLPIALSIEGAPPALSATNLAGYAYLSIVGSALAYVLWFRGIRTLPASGVAFLSLCSPLMATTLGWLALDQRLTVVQLIGAVIVLASVIVSQTRIGRPTRKVSQVPLRHETHPSGRGHSGHQPRSGGGARSGDRARRAEEPRQTTGSTLRRESAEQDADARRAAERSI